MKIKLNFRTIAEAQEYLEKRGWKVARMNGNWPVFEHPAGKVNGTLYRSVVKLYDHTWQITAY